MISHEVGGVARRLLAVVAAVLVLGVLPFDGGAANATTAALKQYGGEVVIGDDQEPPTLNPFVPGGDNFIVSKIGQAYWAGVQDIDGFTLELIPDVVTELPTVANGGITVNDDGTETVRYQIRAEAVWADGVPISGDDFLFTYQTIVDPALPIDTTIYEDILPQSVVAGPKTFEYTLTQPTVQAELLFGTILPKHDVEGSDFVNDWNDTMWVSGGPFIFDEWQFGNYIRLVRNDNFWKTDPETGQQLPYLDAVVFRFIPDVGSLIDAFKARELDVFSPPPSIEVIEDLQTLEPEGASIEVLSGPIWEHLTFQFGDNRIARNPSTYNEHLNYRKAVAHAIDKQKIVDEILEGQVAPLDSYVDAFSPTLSQGAWAQYDYNPATAQQYITDLCAQAGTDCGAVPPKAIFTTTSNNDARVRLSQLLAPMFTDAGIEYQAQLEDSSLFFGETLDFGLWDVGEWAWVGTPGLAGLVSIHDVFDPEAPPPDGSNFYRWGTPAVSGTDPGGFNQGPSSVIDASTARFAEVRDEMNATVDEAELTSLINEAETILADNVVVIPLYARLDPGAVWADEIGGYKHNPSQAGDTWNIEEWHRVDAINLIVGLVDPAQGRWHLRDSDARVTSFYYGDPGDFPFMGDWDCDGVRTPGLYRQSDGFVYLRNSNTQGIADIKFFFGNPGDVPIAGDFNGDGCDTVSIYRPSEQRFYIINELGKDGAGLGAADFSFLFGDPGDKPVVGDWDGDGIDEVGLHRETTGQFFWRNSLTTGIAHGQIIFGNPSDRFVAGDFGIVDGKETPAVFRPSDTTFYFRHTLTQGNADAQFLFGESTFLPVVGSNDLE